MKDYGAQTFSLAFNLGREADARGVLLCCCSHSPSPSPSLRVLAFASRGITLCHNRVLEFLLIRRVSAAIFRLQNSSFLNAQLLFFNLKQHSSFSYKIPHF